MNGVDECSKCVPSMGGVRRRDGRVAPKTPPTVETSRRRAGEGRDGTTAVSR